jgi:hypothetical protein
LFFFTCSLPLILSSPFRQPTAQQLNNSSLQRKRTIFISNTFEVFFVFFLSQKPTNISNPHKQMLMLSISSAGKLVTLAMASFMLASSSFAAPMVNLHRGDIVRAIDCVKIQDDSIHDVVVQGEQTPIKIDVSGCEPSLLDTTHPWTVTLVNCEHHEDTVKLAELVSQTFLVLSTNEQRSNLAEKTH